MLDSKNYCISLDVLRTLRDAGYEAYFAGGCVRDRLLNVTPHDFDVATSALPEEVAGLFSRVLLVGARFGVSVVVMEDIQVEVATFRSEGGYADGRRPQHVRFTTVEEDARRRDFTINGMFWDPKEDRILDFVGGQEDLAKGVIRAIGHAEARFQEDHLRMLRAVRFAARLDFHLHPDTLSAIGKLSDLIKKISGERIAAEFERMLTHPSRACAMKMLDDLGLLKCIMPEVTTMHGVLQPKEFHPEGDVWVHTMLCMEYLKDPSWPLALATLLHDIGKPVTITFADRIRFNGHDAEGARMSWAISERLRTSKKVAEKVAWLVASHMHLKDAPNMRQAKLKRLLRHADFEDLLELYRVDVLASFKDLSTYDFCCRKLVELSVEELAPQPLLRGRDLIALGLVPGPEFSRILGQVEEAQLEGALTTREEALALVQRIANIPAKPIAQKRSSAHNDASS